MPPQAGPPIYWNVMLTGFAAMPFTVTCTATSPDPVSEFGNSTLI
jgi:hypothetical protein